MKVEQPSTSPVLETRAGSALLIVIGTLALISVFAVVYISIGRTDRRAANAVSARNNQKDTSTNFGEYLSTIVGNDRLDAFAQYTGRPGDPFGRREVTDAPYTDWTRRSESDFDDGRDLFTPIGGPFSTGRLNLSNDFSVASDPWLASTTPVYLGNPGFQNVDRPFSTYDGFSTNYPNAKNFLDNRDWLQISNFAPDGRFVNLYNLRPTSVMGFDNSAIPVDGIIGRFDAESGTGFSTDPSNGREIRRMSNYLSLWDQEVPGDPESLLQAFDPFEDGIWVPGQNFPLLGILAPEDVFNTPAVWTMYQRFMFMPINQPFITLNRNGDVSSWADPDFPAYQYADADGDGMADSRWIELTAAQDEDHGDSPENEPRKDIKVLYDREDYRYFIAARAMDLSSLVNVNTATDLLVPPTKDYPLGLTPADVDLRRLLTMQDAAGDYASVVRPTAVLPLSYQALHRPYLDDDFSSFGSPDPLVNFARNVNDYWYYNQPALGMPGDLRTLENNSSSMLIGRYAYDALRQGIMLGSSLSDDYEGFDYSFQIPTERQHLLQYERDPADNIMVPPGQITAEIRVKQYNEVGKLDPANTSTSWSRGTEFGSALYGMDDLVELLTFHGLNDPEITTRLERVTTGRYKSLDPAGHQTQRLGPLMSNRSLALDREQHGLALIDIFRDPRVAPSSDDSEKREINGRISFNSMAHFGLTPRSKMTMISGSVGLVPSGLVEDPSKPEALTELSAAPDLKTVILDENQLFALYLSSLAGEISTPDGFMSNNIYWPVDTSLTQNHLASALFYGHRGPELSLRIAAHTAVNMKDMTDGDQDPTVATLILDNSVRDELINGYMGDDVDDPAYLNYPGRSNDVVFDPGEDFMIDGRFTGFQDHRKAVNVFGFEPMPILTEVSSMYVYADSDKGNGEVAQDFNSMSPILLGNRVLFPGERKKVMIDGSVIPGNIDFKMQVLAFQLTNPWDVSITIGNPGNNGRMGYIEEEEGNNSNLRFDYYIEFGGRFFKLGEFIEYNPLDDRYGDPAGPDVPPTADSAITLTHKAYQYQSVTIPRQSSRVFYAIADGRFDAEDLSQNIDASWLSELVESGSPADEFTSPAFDLDGDGLPDGLDRKGWTGPAEEWVNEQFTGGIAPAIHIHQFDPTTGFLVEEDGFHDLFSPPASPVYTDAERTHDLKQARLWRKIKGSLEENDESSLPTGAVRENRIQNDMLVDRLSASVDGFFVRTLVGGDNEIEGTYGYDPESYGVNDVARIGARNDNFGFSIVRWATVRRGDNPSGAEAHSEGKIASWMMGSRDIAMNTIESDDQLGGADLTLNISHFLDGSLSDLGNRPLAFEPVRSDYEIHGTFSDMFRAAFSGREVIRTIIRRPRSKVGISTGFQQVEPDLAIRFPAKILGSNRMGQILHQSGGNLVPELYVNGQFKDVPRLADLLLAWGIGPTYTPDPDRTAIDISFDDNDEAKRWITLPEAIAFGLGYENVTAYNPSESEAESVWLNAFVTPDDQVLDNGHLVIDNFVSYVNRDTLVPPTFDPIGDLPRGTGVPMALGVIDHARAIAPLSQVTDPQNPTPAQQLEIDLGRPTFGQVNINTAPIEVLRLLPGLTPSRASYYKKNILGTFDEENEWWGSGRMEFRPFDPEDPSELPQPLELPDLSLANMSENPDVAAAIVAYRDRTYGIPNTAARPEPYPAGIYDLSPLNLEPTDPLLFAKNMRGEFPSMIPLPSGIGSPSADRSAMTGIDGLRPTPGFGSLGELLAVRIDPAFEAFGGNRWNVLKHLSIQQYGTDGKASGVVTSVDDDEVRITIMSQLFRGENAGSTKDDYAEKISMANSVLNTLSVRSDYYAVWFVVHGYQESDVANLRPEDPLIPTIKKRYLMVVDRTNVIEPGDKPKILVFKELPL